MNDLTWHLNPALTDQRDRLFDEHGLRLDEWRAAGLVHAIKEAPHRSVYRVTLPGLDFHLKYYPTRDLGAVLRLRPSKARREFDLAIEVARRGVPTIEPLAWAESVGVRGASCLITRTLPATISLGAFLENDLPRWEPARASQLRQRLAQKLGQFVAILHDAGVQHDDLHPGNFLLTLDGEEPSLFLIDLLACRLQGPLDWSASRENLSLLNRWFMLRSSPTDRLRFWRSYEAARGASLPPDTPGRRERDLEKASLHSNLRLWATFDRRCRNHKGAFRRIATTSVRGHYSTQLSGEVVEPIARDPDALFLAPGSQDIKASRSARVARVVDPRDPEGILIWKRFAVTTWTDPWTALVRLTPALRSWVMGHTLRSRGIPTPMPLLVLHRLWLTLPHEGYLLTEELPQGRHLGDHLDHLLTRPPAEREARLRAVLIELADVVARLHRARLSHRDLKASNVLISPKPWVMPNTDKGATAEPPTQAGDHVWLIDLVGLSQQRRMSRRRKIRNLARLNASFRDHPLVSLTTRLRFLKWYLGIHGLDPSVWRAYWHGIAAATQAKVARNRRVGRALH